jgi:hypothetical protein
MSWIREVYPISTSGAGTGLGSWEEGPIDGYLYSLAYIKNPSGAITFDGVFDIRLYGSDTGRDYFHVDSISLSATELLILRNKLHTTAGAAITGKHGLIPVYGEDLTLEIENAGLLKAGTFHLTWWKAKEQL